jgi:hypothetical protein
MGEGGAPAMTDTMLFEGAYLDWFVLGFLGLLLVMNVIAMIAKDRRLRCGECGMATHIFYNGVCSRCSRRAGGYN